MVEKGKEASPPPVYIFGYGTISE